MDNKLKSKTRLAAIQLVSQQLVNNQDIELIKDDFDKHYLNTKIDNTSEKILYNISFLSKLVRYFKTIDIKNLSQEINNQIKFDRKFENWDTINKDIILDKNIFIYFAETCGNRTHLPVFHQNSGFEDRGVHQEHYRFHI